MKRLSAIAMALALVLTSSPTAYSQAKQTDNVPPPVAPALVREGDFATRLVSSLEIGTAESEAEAETMLASAMIAPKNGWISDYPVTPDILVELEDAVAAAADSNRLPMDKDQALVALESVSADLGLSMVAQASEEYGETPPPVSPEYAEPTVINNYYYREGPPVFTYYPPPPDYLYLYAWVPYPFWCSRFYFSGFFILHDFHKVSIIHQRAVIVSNHFFHRGHRKFFRVDPVKRGQGRSLIAAERRTHGRAPFTAKARRGSRSILQRSHDRLRYSRGLVDKNAVFLNSPIGAAGILRNKPSQQTPTFNGRARARAQTFPRQKIQTPQRDTARSLTPFGRNKGIASHPPTALRRDSAEAAQRIRAVINRNRARARTSPSQEVQRAQRESAKSLRAPGINEGKSSSQPSAGGRGFANGFHGGRRGFSGSFSGKLPAGPSSLRAVPKAHF